MDRPQIFAHPAQRIGADGFGARLFDGVIDRTALGRLRPAPGMGGGVVVGQAQGHLVGQATDARGVLRA